MFNVICLDQNGDVISELTQWDINQSIVIEDSGLTTAPHFHFCNKNSREALVVASTLKDNKIIVKIPNLLLQEPYPIIAYIYDYSDISSGKSIQRIKIPIISRVKPSDYEYVENIDRITADKVMGDIVDLKDKVKSLPNIYATKDHSHSTATSSKAGFMSADDWIKLSHCLTEHPNIITSFPTGSPNIISPDFGGKVALMTNMERDDNGHVTNFEIKVLELPKLPEDVGNVNEKIGDIKMFVGAHPTDSQDQPNLTNGIVHLILDTLGKQENRSWMKIYGKDGIDVTTDEDTNIVISGNGLGGGTSDEAITTEEIDEACDYLPVDDSGVKPLTDKQIDEICDNLLVDDSEVKPLKPLTNDQIDEICTE